MKPYLFWLLPAALLAVLAGCTSAPVTVETFVFASGGAYHPSGLGEWRVSLNGLGSLGILHDVAGKVTDYGSFNLTADENKEIWTRVHAVDFGHRVSAARPGVPDEVQYTFGLNGKEVKLWVNDAREDEKIAALVDQLGRLIESTTGQKPVLN